MRSTLIARLHGSVQLSRRFLSYKTVRLEHSGEIDLVKLARNVVAAAVKADGRMKCAGSGGRLASPAFAPHCDRPGLTDLT